VSLPAHIGHSAVNTRDKVDADIVDRDSALLALSGFWIANHPTRLCTRWSPEKNGCDAF